MTVAAGAQHCSEFFVGGGIGMSTLQYKITGTERSNGFGGNVKLGYTYLFLPEWGITTGVEMAFYNTSLSISSYTNSYEINNPAYPAGYQFIVTETGSGYEEQQKATFIQIPLMLKSRHPGIVTFYISAGVKLAIPLQTTYSGSFSEFSIKGYSEYTNQVHENEPEYGFSTYQQMPASGDMILKIGALLAVEAGLEGRISRMLKFYIGIYFDYGFTNFLPSSSDYQVSTLQFNNNIPVVYSSAVNAQAPKLVPLAVGGTLRFSINSKAFKSVEKRKRTSRIIGDACDCLYQGSL